ncbi:MAG TPA: hypothetical protein VFG19_00025 [Geobacteraceae bacterium]|nr:hypothetical protein [Geobacteraceae bacterium]
MGLIKYLKDRRMRSRTISESQSLDWGVAESAIRRIPDVLSAEESLEILIPLSRGKGSHLANPLNELPATLTFEFSANVHLSSTIAALGKLKDMRASERLVEIVHELPNFASQALNALGSPMHAAFASRLAAMAANWSHELRYKAAGALWRMETEEALEAYLKIQLEDGSPFSEEVMRKGWTSRMEEIRNPSSRASQPRKRVPLP